MAKTYPNQNIIVIKKTPCKTNFLQISNEELASAAVDFDKSFNAFKLYLYLAGNEIGYEKALSFVDFCNKFHVQKSSYYNSFNLLLEKGYLVPAGKNVYNFYTSPQNSTGVENSIVVENSARMENSIAVEKNKSIGMENSIRVENSSGMEKSIGVENSTVVEKIYDTFDF